MYYFSINFRSPRRDHRDSSAPRRSGGGGGPGRNTGGGQRRAPPERRVFVSNIPFEMKWQEIKDLFRDNVGDVSYVELFNDENEKPRGCGILEFATDDLAKNAIEKMHRHEYKGRKLGMVSHKISLITIFGYKHFRQKFIKNLNFFTKKFQQPLILVHIWYQISDFEAKLLF